jgi:hypothetical protein
MRLKNNLIATWPEDHDMSSMSTSKVSAMKHSSIIVCTVLAALAFGGAASAQMLAPGASRFNPPPLAPLPGPKIEVPAVPQMDAPPKQNFTSTPRPSFSDRISTCLDMGAAAGLDSSDRAAFSRSCAN